MNDVFATIKSKKEELQKLMQEEGEKALKDAFKGVFADGSVKRIGWTQYTPYFNDGDPCEFGFHELHVDFGPEVGASYGEYDEEGDNLYNWWEVYSLNSDYGNTKERLAPIPQDTKDKLVQLNRTMAENEDLLLAVFGDHVKVVATPTEISSEHYSHD